MADHVAELRTTGYSVIRGVLAADEVTELGSRMDELLVEDDLAWGAERLTRTGQRGALRNLADRGEVFERLLGTQVIHDVATEIIGRRYLLHSYDGLVLQPGEGRYPWDFHTDLLDLCGVAFPEMTSPGLNCLAAVDGSNERSGATWVVSASHGLLERNIATEKLVKGAIQPALEPGDLLFFDARLWHCAGENTGQSARRLIKILLVQPWLRPQMDYARSVRPEVQARLVPVARASLGTPPPVSVAEFLAECERGT
jgi:ectoine hydroxylase-related dioxygenase (phytanoyl-CoA dioxygenase family)